MADVLTREQLEEQLKRRRTHLKYLEQTCADEKEIEKLRKDLRLTEKRLERLSTQQTK